MNRRHSLYGREMKDPEFKRLYDAEREAFIAEAWKKTKPTSPLSWAWSTYRVMVGVLFAVAFSADNIFMAGFWLFIFVTSYMAEEAGPNKEKKP